MTAMFGNWYFNVFAQVLMSAVVESEGAATMENKRFLNVNDVAEIMDISVSMAYKVIRRLNNELASQGYIVITGKVSREYFEEKVYSKTGTEV